MSNWSSGPGDLMRDVRDAVRQARRAPAFTAVVVLTMAIGIGANTAVYSVIRPLLLAPLPVRDASSLVWLPNIGSAGLSGATHQVNVFEELARRTRSFSDMTGYFAFFGYGTQTITGDGPPERLSIVPVAPRFFEILGVQPALGGLFAPEESRPNGPRAIVLSHAFWQRRFGGDTSVVGRSLTIENVPVRVAGVLPATFDFSSIFTPGTSVEAFVPAVLDEMRTWGNTLAVVARLAPGASMEQARDELAGVVSAIHSDRPEWGNFGVRLTALQEHVSGPLRRSLVVLWGAVAAVLLIVCANVSNLLIARSTARSREFAVRIALGADRLRVMRQLLVEGLLLSALAGLVGVALAHVLTALVRSQINLAIPLLYRVEVDAAALAVTAIVSLGAGLIVSVLPGLRLSAVRPQVALADDPRGATGSRRQTWIRTSLVVAEIAMACVLVVAGSLLSRSFLRVVDADFGFRPATATALTIDLNDERPFAQKLPLVEEAVRRVASIEGVSAAGLTDALPLDNNRSWGVGVPGATYPPGQAPSTFVYIVGPGYIEAMGMTLRGGRTLAATDTQGTSPVVVLSESLARTLYPGQDAVGRAAGISNRAHTIVGVVADVRQTALESRQAHQIYLAYAQRDALPPTLVIRSAGSAATLARVRDTLTALDPALLVTAARPLDDLVDRAASPRRFLTTLVGTFSIVALFIAGLGTYATVSFGVGQRTREIGVRMALGATTGDVWKDVLGGTLRIAAAGIAIGVAGALAVSRLLSSLLFEVSAVDPATFGSAIVTLVVAAVAAGLLPAIRASRISPRQALN